RARLWTFSTKAIRRSSACFGRAGPALSAKARSESKNFRWNPASGTQMCSSACSSSEMDSILSKSASIVLFPAHGIQAAVCTIFPQSTHQQSLGTNGPDIAIPCNIAKKQYKKGNEYASLLADFKGTQC